MTADLDIWRTANLLVKQHGSEASAFAAERVEALHSAGDIEGLATWRRVLPAIEALKRDAPEPGERVN